MLKLRRIARFSPAQDHGPRPRAGGAGRRLGMALGVVVALFTTGLASAAPATAAGGTAPADLLNLPALQSTATAAQEASLEDFEQQAVEDTLTDHELPSTDFDAAQTWGRDAAEGELWSLLVQAINTPAAQQTTDQANAVAWLSNLVVQQNVQAADDAGLEYTKWAGLGASAYESLLATNPTEGQLSTFLSGDPLNYGPGYNPSSPQSTSDEGYCLYDPPAGGPSYTNSIFYDSGDEAPEDCYVPAGSAPPTPPESNFVTWGAIDADEPLFDNSQWTAVDNDIAESLGFGVAASAGLATGFALGFTPAVATLLQGSTLAFMLSPFAGIAPAVGAQAAVTAAAEGGPLAVAEAQAGVAAADVAGIAGIVITALAVAVIEAVNVITAAEIPGQLAQLISNAPSQAPDLASMLQSSSGATAVYSLFVNATLPEPTVSSCDNPTFAIGGPGGTVDNPTPCLNAPAIPAANTNDPTLTITENGATTSTTSSTLDWESVGGGATESAYISGNWFVDTMTSGSASVTFQTLDIHYTNWAGDQEVAWLVDEPSMGYQFVTTEADASPPVNTATCLSLGTCSAGPSIQYIGTDGNDYTASFLPASGVPNIPQCPQFSICDSTSTSLTSVPQVAQAGQPVTLVASTGGGCSQVVGGPSQCSPVPGTVTFVELTGTQDTTLCSGIDVSSGTATCTWTPTTTGSYQFYATYYPASGSGNAGSQAELTLPVGTLAPTTTTVTASSSAPAADADVDYTATVAGSYPGSPAPTGTVTFTQGSTVLCPAEALAQGTDGYTATCSTSYAQVGQETVTATYSGDSATTTSSGSATVSVVPGPTTITVTVPPVVVAGKPFSVAINISAAGISPSSVIGTASVVDESDSSGASCITLMVGGIGSCQFTAPNAGPLTLQVTYVEPYNNDSTASATEAVTVDSPTITVSVRGNQTYGSSEPPVIGFVVSPPTGVGYTGTVSCTRVEGGASVSPSLPGGEYTLDGSSCSGLTLTGTYAGEFSISYTGVSDGFTVRPVQLIISAPNPSPVMTYGGPVPVITPSYQGFVNGDTASSLTTPATCSTTATVSSERGDYPVTCSGAADPSYTISYQTGTLVVRPAPLTITASSPTVYVGQPVPAITPTFAGFVDGQGPAVLGSELTCSTSATSSSPVGTYTSTCSGAEDVNYDITYVAGTVTIDQRVAAGPGVDKGTAPTTSVPSTLTSTSTTVTTVPTSSPGTAVTTVTTAIATTGTTATTGTASTPPTTTETSTTGISPSSTPTTTSSTVTSSQTTTTTAGTSASSTGSTSSGQTPTSPGQSTLQVAVLTSLSPSAGPLAGGTTVVIRGHHFVGVEKIRFGGKAARFKVVSANELIAHSPAGTGIVTVVVTTSAGASDPSKTGPGHFTYLAKSRVLRLAPVSGPHTGGTRVVITGKWFEDVDKVRFGSQTAGFKVLSSTEIIAYSPAGSGTVALSVTTPGGTSAAVKQSHFTYAS